MRLITTVLIYIADTGNQNVRVIANGVINTLAGTGTAGFNGDGVVATAQLSSPTGVAVDAGGNVYVADSGNNRVRRIASGQVTTVAGSSSMTFSGDGGNSIAAALNAPLGIALDGRGDFVDRRHGQQRCA